ncbi:UNVERIFIED_ORG: hypothetical protein LHJ69_00475 [Shinella sp. XGS7]|nr:hypothetical protein [Shinella sp. XGS7]
MQHVAAFQEALLAIRTALPWLVVEEVARHPQVDAFAQVPAQPGLSLPIQVNLQNDELHLVASNLWVEWFPCTDISKRDAFVQAVSGLVNGELEIEESFVFGRPAMATLRSRAASGNQCLARWSNLLVLLPLPRNRRIVRNEYAV